MTPATIGEKASKSRWLNRSVLGIGLASLCSDVGHEMATTAMPALLASLGASSAILGLIEGLADGLSSFAKLPLIPTAALRLRRAMDSAGAVIGSALSLVLVTAVGMRATFLLTLIPGLIAVALIASVVREKPHTPDLRHGFWHGMNHLPRASHRYLAGVGIAGLGDFSNTLLILGVLATVNGIGDFIASVSVGALWVVSPVYAMIFVTVTSLCGAVIIGSTRPVPIDNRPGTTGP